MGEFPFGALSGPFAVSVSDSFGNAIAYNNVNLAAVAITVAASGGSGFDNGGASLLTTISCTTHGINSCNASNGGQINLNYYQGYTAYGFVGAPSAPITGTYYGNVFSVSSSSGNIITGTDSPHTPSPQPPSPQAQERPTNSPSHQQPTPSPVSQKWYSTSVDSRWERPHVRA